MNISGFDISELSSPYIIAEISANHGGKLERAMRLIELAKESGANAVKLQTYTPDTMTIKCDRSDFMIKGGLWDGYTLYDLYQEAHTPWEWHGPLFKKAEELGITIFSTPFDETSVDFLEKLNVPAYKVASFEMTDLPLLEYIASKKKPIILSTGMANIDEIEEAVETVKKYHRQLVLLHCVSGYPVPVDQSNLKTIADLRERFKISVGLSDHTLGTVVSVAAISLGATVIEKHFVESREHQSPDSSFSLVPAEFKELVTSCRAAYVALGQVGYEQKEVEKDNHRFRRSIYFVREMKAGDVITTDCVRRIRPGYGLAPKHLNSIIGRRVSCSISKGTPVSWDKIAP